MVRPKIVFSLMLVVGWGCFLFSQKQQKGFIRASVVNSRTNTLMANVHVLNLTQVFGSTTDQKGNFEIRAAIKDTLLFSFLGFKPLKVTVTNDMVKYVGTKIMMTELAYALEEVVVTPHKLTGHLNIDALSIPITIGRRYSISGLPQGYEAKEYSPSVVTQIIGGIFNPADGLYNIFGRKPKEMKKLRKMRKNNQVKNFLLQKYDRQTILEFLNMTKYELQTVLINCNYSDIFVKEANDLQILEGVSDCYEKYNILSAKR